MATPAEYAHLLIAAVRSNGNSLTIQPGTTTTAAVFGSLRAGRYELRIKDAAGTEHPAPVVVEGAQVTWVTWAGATRPPQ